MILILTPNIEPESDTYKQLMGHLSRLHNIQCEFTESRVLSDRLRRFT